MLYFQKSPGCTRHPQASLYYEKHILVSGEKTAFDAVAFVSSEEILNEREKALVSRYADRNVLFLTVRSETKAALLKEFVRDLGERINIVNLHASDSRYLLPYLAGETARTRLSVDITFAPPYYASVLTLICRRPRTKICYTQGDGSCQVIYQSGLANRVKDSPMKAIIDALTTGAKTLSELEKLTGLNYKTLARRTANLLREGMISKTDEYPIRYYVTDEQALSNQLSPGAYESVAEGKMYQNAAAALFSQDSIVLDNTIPKPTGESGNTSQSSVSNIPM